MREVHEGPGKALSLAALDSAAETDLVTAFAHCKVMYYIPRVTFPLTY
jgi:hypothetical protein